MEWWDKIEKKSNKNRKILSMCFISYATGLHLNQFHAANLTTIFHPIIIAIWISEECRKQSQQTIKTENTNNNVVVCAQHVTNGADAIFQIGIVKTEKS